MYLFWWRVIWWKAKLDFFNEIENKKILWFSKEMFWIFQIVKIVHFQNVIIVYNESLLMMRPIYSLYFLFITYSVWSIVLRIYSFASFCSIQRHHEHSMRKKKVLKNSTKPNNDTHTHKLNRGVFKLKYLTIEQWMSV